jgi:thymidylate synthase
MSKIDKTYHQLLNKIITDGYTYEDPNRKNVNRIEIPSYTFRHEFKDGFPAITTKKLHYKNVVTELIWFLRGDTNIKYLVDNGCNIWNKDAYNYYLKWLNSKNLSKEDFEMFSLDFKQFIETVKEGFKDKDYTYGDLGPVYGKQWRDFGGVDQIKDLIQGLKDKPLGTEHIVTAWNPGEKSKMALPACHYGFQIVVKPLPIHKRKELGSKYLGALPKLATAKEYEQFLNDNNISKYGFELHWSQRSIDTFLGLPYNIASYATLALILEKITGYKALAIQGDLKKVHLYDNSLDAVKEQLSRDINKYDNTNLLFKDEFHYITDKELCGEVSLDKIIFEMKSDWFVLENYKSYPHIVVPMLERDK